MDINGHVGPEKLLRRLETLPNYFPNVKYEFAKLRDAEGDKNNKKAI